MWEFIKKHKIPLIILGASVGLYLLYDYLRAASGANANSAAGDTNAADQAALQDELASLENGASGQYGGSTSSPIASSPAVTGSIPSSATTSGSLVGSTSTSAPGGASPNPSTPAPVIPSLPGLTPVGNTQTSAYSGSTQSSYGTSLIGEGSGSESSPASDELSQSTQELLNQYGTEGLTAQEAAQNAFATALAAGTATPAQAAAAGYNPAVVSGGQWNPAAAQSLVGGLLPGQTAFQPPPNEGFNPESGTYYVIPTTPTVLPSDPGGHGGGAGSSGGTAAKAPTLTAQGVLQSINGPNVPTTAYRGLTTVPSSPPKSPAVGPAAPVAPVAGRPSPTPKPIINPNGVQPRPTRTPVPISQR